ncbi:MAG: hypothetical protein ACRDTD_06575 [Pseudonocardiaceae bacterium]
MIGLVEPLWCVIVVRAWREAGGLRARLLRADKDGYTTAVESSAHTAALRLESWLELCDDSDDQERDDDPEGLTRK